MAAKKRKDNGKANIRVRMYRVGMGDCFLVTIPATGRNRRHILIDCGVHAQSKFKGLAESVVAMEEETGGQLAVVVATHAHADHISGFGSEPFFGRASVDEVWMPWLENLSDPAAKKLHAKAAALTAMIDAHSARAAADGAPPDPLIEWVTLNALGAKGRSSTGNNAKALERLRGGFGDAKRTKYLKAGDVLSDAGGITGLTVRVLAPSADTTFLSRMHPPESQLYGLDEQGMIDPGRLQPFGDHWKTPVGVLDDEYRAELVQSCAVPLQALALSVDNYLNNTSLALLLQYRGKTLLFPGDAQWGNWQSWQEDWKSLLGEIDFYKVGHHGSHNATPQGALELMTANEVVAMVSTDTVTTFNRGHFPVPYPKLMSAVEGQMRDRLARSDQLTDAPEPFEPAALWCDYVL